MQDDQGLWNGFFSFMCRHLTLGAWTTASSCLHRCCWAWWGGWPFALDPAPPQIVTLPLGQSDTISEPEMILAIPTRVGPRDLRGRAHSVCRSRASLLVSSVASFNKRPLCSGEQREQHIDLGESLSG